MYKFLSNHSNRPASLWPILMSTKPGKISYINIISISFTFRQIIYVYWITFKIVWTQQ